MKSEPDQIEIPAKSKVWIVEDDENVRLLLTTQFKLKGMNVKQYPDGQSCLNALKAEDIPDVILLDVMMPGIDGFTVLRSARQTYTPAVLPIIIVTALSRQEDILRGFELGANDYVTKPFDLPEVFARVRVHARLRELLSEQKSELEKLQQVDQLKDEALLTVSHDLKNPISVIQSGIELLEDSIMPTGTDSSIFKQILGSMQRAAEVMLPIVDEFLNLEALKSRRLRITKETVVINKLVNEVIQQHQQDAERRKITLTFKPDSDEVKCEADSLRIRQVISNLVSNAIKYSNRESEVIIKIKDRKDKVYVAVKDSGKGIKPEDIPLLFEAFTPLSKQNDVRSTGVGLYISRKLIERHDGVLDVKSEVGKGSTFWFEIPKVSVPAEDADKNTTETVEEATSKAPQPAPVVEAASVSAEKPAAQAAVPEKVVETEKAVEAEKVVEAEKAVEAEKQEAQSPLQQLMAIPTRSLEQFKKNTNGSKPKG